MDKFDPSHSLGFCPAACGEPVLEDTIIDARGRHWHYECTLRTLALIARADETRGDEYISAFKWVW